MQEDVDDTPDRDREHSANGRHVRSLEQDRSRDELSVAYNDGMVLHFSDHWLREETGGTTAIEFASPEKVRNLCLPVPGISWRRVSTAAGLLLESEWRRDDSQLECTVRITNVAEADVALRLEQTVLGCPLQGMCFAPSLRADYDMNKSGVAFWYRSAPDLSKGLSGGNLAIPMVTFYDRKQDSGFTIAAHIEAPTPPFACETRGDQLVIQRRCRVAPGNSTVLRHFVVRHEGCWRPGLRWVRDAHPDYFMTDEATVDSTHGCFVYTNSTDTALCDEFEGQGVKNVEIHWTYPFFGKVVPEEEPWVKMVDDKWNAIKRTTDPDAPPEDAPYEEIKRYVALVTNPSGRRDDIRTFISELKARGMQAFMYFNPTESWEFFALQEFPDSIIRRPDGAPQMTWFDHVVMDCRPESRWGQYLREEVRALLAIYPDADGIFMDQSALDPDDFRVSRITDALAGIVEQSGKKCYWNGPCMVDLMQHAVGLLGELGPLEGERIKWLTIGNKVCCGLGHTEVQYQRNLLNGLWPPAPSLIHARSFRVSDITAHPKPIPEELAHLHGTYTDLYERFPGKTWFLGPNPLDVPDGAQANIFQTRDGEYLIPVIVPGHRISDGPAVTDARITVRVPDAERIRAASVRSVNLPGERYRVELEHQGNQLLVTIPWLGSACLLELTRSNPSCERMPTAPGGGIEPRERPLQVICAVIRSEGVAPTGNLDSIENGLSTSAPLSPVPVRKVFLNGTEIGTLGSANSWHWHPHVGVGIIRDINVDITSILKRDNELRIEPDGPQDFFKVRNISMLVVYSDGRAFHSGTDPNTYSSCLHDEAEGITGSPIRIPVRFTELPES